MMKKILCLVIALLLACGSALAAPMIMIGDYMEVVKCKEFITLREEPSTKAAALDRVPLGAAVQMLGGVDEQFSRVLYGGQAGYVLSEYLQPVQEAGYLWVYAEPVEGEAEFENINRFLTAFTEQYFLSPAGYFDMAVASDQEMVQFAIEHIWFNHNENVEWGEWGENNVRLSDEFIAPVCEEYFGRAPAAMDSLYMDYTDGYYYWQETGGHVPGGFARMHYFERVGEEQYRVTFTVHGMYGGWDESVFAMTSAELAEHPEYMGSYQPVGSAVFTAPDIFDLSTWELDWICMDWEG